MRPFGRTAGAKGGRQRADGDEYGREDQRRSDQPGGDDQRLRTGVAQKSD